MKSYQAAIAAICAVLIALLALIAAALNTPAEPEPPEVNAAGLCHPAHVTAPTPEPEPEYEMLYTDEDVIAVAKMLWGEARGCTVDNQTKCVWVVCNRVDDPRFPDTILGVVSQPGQFYGYDPENPVTDELCVVALGVLTRWSMEKQGAAIERELAPEYLWFTGDGVANYFRGAY